MQDERGGASKKWWERAEIWVLLFALGGIGIFYGWPHFSKFFGMKSLQPEQATEMGEQDQRKEGDEGRGQAARGGDPRITKTTTTKTTVEQQTEVVEQEKPQSKIGQKDGQSFTGAGTGIAGGGRSGNRDDEKTGNGEEDLSDQPQYVYSGRGPYAPGSGAGIAQPDYSTAGGSSSGKSGKVRTAESSSGKKTQAGGQKAGSGINSTGTTHNPFPGSAIARAVVKPAESVQGSSSTGVSASVDGSGATGISSPAGLDKTTRYLALLGLGGKMLDSVLAFFRSPGEGGDVVEFYANPPEPGKDLPEPVGPGYGQNPYKFVPKSEPTKITVDKASFEACISRWSQIANPEGLQGQASEVAQARAADICTASLLSADPESGMMEPNK